MADGWSGRGAYAARKVGVGAADAGRVVPDDDDGGEDGGGGDEAGGVGRGTSNAGIEEGEMRQFTNPLCDGKMT